MDERLDWNSTPGSKKFSVHYFGPFSPPLPRTGYKKAQSRIGLRLAGRVDTPQDANFGITTGFFANATDNVDAAH
jgi:hypothetical protein